MTRRRAPVKLDVISGTRGPVKVGVISDTHGLVRAEALRALRDADVIVHAGDIGSPDVLEALQAVAPVIAVRGNNDRGPWARAIPERVTQDIGGARVHVLHDVHELDRVPAGVDVVIAGHSHRPSLTERDGVMFLNPGSAGPRRFTLPISVATITLDGGRPRARIITLDVSKARAG